ncbi:hypothetical protein [Brevibacillus porteri]|uniref:hypothetical protein n=1 Tax=Brevibacillus porteri TaxID=2126350 RepID=UPI003D21A32A
MEFQLDSKKKIIAVLITVIIAAMVVLYLRESVFTFKASDYEDLSRGMSQEEVSRVLGKRSKLLYEKTQDDGVVVTSYMWTNPDGSLVEARFENNKLKFKTERGLVNKK